MLKALLIEDNPLWKMKIQVMLDEINVTVLGATCNVKDSINFLKTTKPDIIIADVVLGNETVFKVFDHDFKFLQIPTIFLTQSSKEIHFIQSQKIETSTYIVKPVHKLTLKSSIETIFAIKNIDQKYFEIKGNKNEKIKLPIEQIVYIEQNGNYCHISTNTKKFVLKKSLQLIFQKLDTNFVQVHRSFIINAQLIESTNTTLDLVKMKGGIEIPIGRVNRENFKTYLAEKIVKDNNNFLNF
jgi:two-component system, LytTR family, response regulator LytT